MSQISALELNHQWHQPNDIFSILLLVGGDIVNRALAQLSGTRLTPVAFSFGWCGYAINILLTVAGGARLMPNTTDGTCLVVNSGSGYARSNVSWVVGRIERDYEHWMDQSVRSKLAIMLDSRRRNMLTYAKRGTQIPQPTQTGLCIAVYEPSKSSISGEPKQDLIYYTSLLVIILQLTVSMIPVIISKDYSVSVITVAGTALALVTGSLSQWRIEKWNCRRASKSTYILTRGAGSQHAIVILGNGHGLNLEDLAVSGQHQAPQLDLFSRLALLIICFLWFALLITAAGINSHTWYLLTIGGIGMLHNVLVAGCRRTPPSQGIHLDFKEVIGEMETMASLLALENKYTKVGKALLPLFFPGRLTDDEVIAWASLEQNQAQSVTGNATQRIFQSWPLHSRTFEK